MCQTLFENVYLSSYIYITLVGHLSTLSAKSSNGIFFLQIEHFIPLDRDMQPGVHEIELIQCLDGSAKRSLDVEDFYSLCQTFNHISGACKFCVL